MTLTEQLRDATHGSGLSLYAIAKATKTPYATIHGFASRQRGINLKTADRLAELLGMKLTAPKVKASKKKGR